MALDAVSTPTIVPIPKGGTWFCINGNEGDAHDGGISIKAAPGSGYAIFITKIILESPDADAFPYLEDEDNNILFGPLYGVANSSASIVRNAEGTAIRMVANKALYLNSAAAGNIFVYVEGKVAKTETMGG